MLLYPRVVAPLIRPVATLLTALFLAGIVAFAGGAPTARADGGTDGISGAPSDGASIDGRSRFSYQVDPGQHLDDFYLVRNTGTTVQNMKIFSTDAFDTPRGEFSLLDTKASPRDSGSWVTFPNGSNSLTVPLAPGESKIVSFRLTVPADASPGDHAGGIVVSVATPQGNIVVDRRIATRLYVRVKGALQAALTVSSITSTYHLALNPFAGSTRVKFTVKNNGNVALGANLVASIKTYFGIGASGLQRTSVAELLPGSTRVVTVDVPGVAQLGYLNPHVSLVPTVDPDALNPGPLRDVERDTTLFVTPWWLLILLVIAAAIVVVVRIRRRLDGSRAAAWIEHTEAEARRKALDEREVVGVGAGAGAGTTAGVDSSGARTDES